MHGSIPKNGVPTQIFSAGFTLLEVLVALVITSIGLLGLAALQANGLRDNHGAYLRTQATYIASDIADRVRANLDAAVAGNYLVNATTPNAPMVPANPGFNCIDNFSGTSNSGECTSGELAQADIFQWYAAIGGHAGPPVVQALLPAGEATINCDDVDTSDVDPCTRTSLFTITVRWDGNRSGATGRNCPPINNNDLSCIRLAFRP